MTEGGYAPFLNHWRNMQSENFRRFPLTPDERALGVFVGELRQKEAERLGHTDRHGADMEDGFNIHIMGATGEVAFCKSINLCRVWNGRLVYPILTVNAGKAPDFGKNIQVRTRSRQSYELIVRDDDSDDQVHVVTVQGSQLWTVKGWVWGHEAKRPEWKKNHGGRGDAWFVPDDALHDLSEIPQDSFTGILWPS